MRIISFIVVFFVFIITGCSSKSDVSINDKIESFNLDKNISVAGVSRTVKSPVSIGLGVGGLISRHVGIHVGTVFRPDIPNSEAVDLQRAINLNNISLSDMIANEFDRQMNNDIFYKDKYVPFGADFSIHLFVQKYYLESVSFSNKALPKVKIDIKIFNKFGEVVYDDIEENDALGRYFIYSENEILNSRETLEKALNLAISNCIAKIIYNMKRD
jgi:hypothetical protein